MIDGPYGKLIENIIQNRKDEKVREAKTVRSGGIGFCGLLAIVFIALKLAGIGAVATWSWWWVLSPLWIPFALVLGIAILAAICIAVCER
jgi:hypothetical protein